MTALPDIHALIVLRDDGREYLSRVEDGATDQLTVARPLNLPAHHTIAIGSNFELSWSRPNGIQVVPVVLAATRREGRVGLWDVSVVGDGWREQRREFVRAEVAGRVHLRITAATDGHRDDLTGTLLDLSESGLRCEVLAPALREALLPGQALTVGINAAGSPFVLMAELVRVAPSTTASNKLELALVFLDHGRTADELRRVVFSQQLADRRDH